MRTKRGLLRYLCSCDVDWLQRECEVLASPVEECVTAMRGVLRDSDARCDERVGQYT